MAGLAERLQVLYGEVDMTPHNAVLGAGAAGVLQEVHSHGRQRERWWKQP